MAPAQFLMNWWSMIEEREMKESLWGLFFICHSMGNYDDLGKYMSECPPGVVAEFMEDWRNEFGISEEKSAEIMEIVLRRYVH